MEFIQRAGFALACCGLASVAQAQQFTPQFSPGIILSFGFDFPQTNGNCPGGSYNGNPPCPQVDYITTPWPSLAGAQVMSFVFAIIAQNAVFNHFTQPDGNGPGQNYVHAYFQQQGDNYSGQGQFAYYRWWNTNPTIIPDGNYTQMFVMNTLLSDPSQWSSVEGENGANSPAATAGFNAAKANVAVIGVTFGGGSFAGHGLNMQSGNAAFAFSGVLAK